MRIKGKLFLLFLYVVFEFSSYPVLVLASSQTEDESHLESLLAMSLDELVNLTLPRKNISKHWDVSLLIKNFLDEDICKSTDTKVQGDYPMERRCILVELRFSY